MFCTHIRYILLTLRVMRPPVGSRQPLPYMPPTIIFASIVTSLCFILVLVCSLLWAASVTNTLFAELSAAVLIVITDFTGLYQLAFFTANSLPCCCLLCGNRCGLSTNCTYYFTSVLFNFFPQHLVYQIYKLYLCVWPRRPQHICSLISIGTTPFPVLSLCPRPSVCQTLVSCSTYNINAYISYKQFF